MKHPAASAPEARRRRAGFLRTTILLAAVVSTVTVTSRGATAAPNAPGGEPPRANQPGSSSAEIAAAQQRVAALEKQLHDLQVQMDKLQATKPADPGPNASEDARKKYKIAYADWTARVDKLQHQIDNVKQQLAVAKKKLELLKAGGSGASS